jgi:hypothetical protein
VNGSALLGLIAAGAIVILLGLVALMWWHGGRRRPETQPFPGRPEAPVFGGEPMPETPVPSSEEDYHFILTGRVFWQPLHSGGLIAHADPRAVALDAIVQRAVAITRTMPPGDPVFAGHRVAAALGIRQHDANRQLAAWATEVAIRVPEKDADRLRRLADLRKKVQVWEHERGHERNVREYLGNDVLTSTGKAVVWWLARNDENVVGAVEVLDKLHQLSAAAQDRLELIPSSSMTTLVDGDEAARDFGPPGFDGRPASDALQVLADQLFPDGDDGRRKLFAHDLLNLADEYELGGFTARVREVFDLPDLADPPDSRDGSTDDDEDPPPDPRPLSPA